MQSADSLFSEIVLKPEETELLDIMMPSDSSITKTEDDSLDFHSGSIHDKEIDGTEAYSLTMENDCDRTIRIVQKIPM